MADTWIQGSFAFTCSNAEMALIEEAFQAAADLMDDCEPTDPTPEFLAIFPPTDPADCWSGFRAIFSDPGFPSFGVDFEGGNSLEAPDVCTICLFSDTDFQPDPLAQLIYRCCRETLTKAPIGFEWAVSCSRPRVGEFGGGWCVIFADRIEIESTGEALSRALSRGVI